MARNFDEFRDIFVKYQQNFNQKVHTNRFGETDCLMNIFGITPSLKNKNTQYWGRELGACWETMVAEVCKRRSAGYSPAIMFNGRQLCDLVAGRYAIDTKYRIGSGDSGTVNKFKDNAAQLIKKRYEPVLLILRNDNLHGTIVQCRNGGWTIHAGEKAFDFIRKIAAGFDMKRYLTERAGAYPISTG
ncbi:hypothetical protein DENIS_3092 [Desulfonema ishimotonii]|uniref:Restriction endonuclease n=1 Tax=Desulfonema ishimotonii TaxID=45657 RepID=A0A401FYT3_9BACT|nr:restriction endonuclease [Desulfonema ishimotonii]GBC62129.1 hypothetical protein DENIS_3092 [Desulfonema ishimotonii]